MNDIPIPATRFIWIGLLLAAVSGSAAESHRSETGPTETLIQRIDQDDERAVAEVLGEDPATYPLLPGGATALQRASSRGSLKVMHWLLDAGVDIDASGETSWRMTPLMAAVAGGQSDALQFLIESGAALDHVDRLGDPAINWAAYYGYTDMVRLLLDAGADKTIRTRHGTAYEIARRRGHRDLINLLESRNDHRPSGLELAVRAADVSAMQDEMRAGESAQSALLLSLRYQCDACVAPALSVPGAINYQDSLGYSPLMVAARDGKAERVARLLGAGADPKLAASKTQAMGMSALHLAAAEGRLEAVRHLIEAGAPLDALNNVGQPPLMWALGSAHESVVRVLIAAGASATIIDQDGNSPRSIAEQMEKSDWLLSN